MRRKIITIAAAGALAVGGAAVGGTAIAATGDTSTGTAASPLDRIKQALSGLVKDGTISQSQADKVASTLSQAGVGEGRGFGHGARGVDLSAAATALGISEADLRTALMSGKSLAAVAKEKNVAVDKVVDAIVKAQQDRIAQAVKDKRITQAQADALLKDLKARVTERVNATPPAGGFGRHGGRGGPGGPGGFGGYGGPSGMSGTPGPSATTSGYGA